jgi:nucleoside-diphosphate-sugar epimerase
VPRLLQAGHAVTALTRSPEKAAALRALGVEPVVGDALDRDAMMRLVTAARPDAVIHQVTSLVGMRSLRRFDHEFAQTNRLRTRGLDILLEAAQAAGARRFLAQSYTSWTNPRDGGPVKSEADPLDPSPPKAMRRTLEAIAYLERAVVGARGLTGLALRYGSFYGPGTSFGADGTIVEAVRQRKLPIVGSGAGIWSFIHLDDAAAATVLALGRGEPGVYNITDDEPTPVSTWLPALAAAVGAPPPRHVPVWLGRLFVGDVGVSVMTQIRGSSNRKAK